MVLVSTLDEACSQDQRATFRMLSDALTDWSAEAAATVLSGLVGAEFLAEHPDWVEDWREQVART